MGALYLVSGSDDFAVKNKARELACSLCGENPEDDSALEIIHGDSDELKADEILANLIASLSTPPFLCPDKKIWLRNFVHFEKVLEGAGKKDSASHIDTITAMLKDGLAADTTLIIDGPRIDKRKAFFKTCKDKGEVFLFDKADISDRDYSRNQFARITQLCREAGKDINPDAADFLASSLGSDSGRLHCELEKLLCYIGDTPRITLADCKNICARTPEAMGWDFANALLSKDLPRSLVLIDTLVTQMRGERGGGNLELAILWQAIGSFQEVVKTKCALKELGITGRCGKNTFYNESLKQQYPDNFLTRLNPFRAYMLSENAAKFPDQQLVDVLNSLLDANRKLVSGGADSRLALEQLAVNITTGVSR